MILAGNASLVLAFPGEQCDHNMVYLYVYLFLDDSKKTQHTVSRTSVVAVTSMINPISNSSTASLSMTLSPSSAGRLSMTSSVSQTSTPTVACKKLYQENL